ncbi:alpha-2,8-polysialyltransferase family protein [Isoptericola hypogeus]|uniref:Alpha-2,8-polysialyltransferase family protein n=1 Tax=Isoptericola hypogeus TaxID=300179 RepID=A0ABN2IRE6_9MICO
MTVQIITASTLFGVATVAAAWDAGALRRRERTLLVVQHDVPVPEAHPAFPQGPGFASLADRFDRVVGWNEVVEPHHPTRWTPRADDVPLWQRLLRGRWGLGDEPVEIVGESVATAPTSALVAIFSGAAVTGCGDGLRAYGPARNALPHDVGGRVSALLHLDLLPGVRPASLEEWDVPTTVVPSESFRKVVAGLADPADGEVLAEGLPQAGGYGLVVGQNLAPAGLVTPDQEAALHRSMVRTAAERGFTEVVLKPHPSAHRHGAGELARHARTLGVTLRTAPPGVLAEQLFDAAPPGLVVSCFSTALATASAVFGLPTASVGTAMLLERLEPFANGDRVPAVAVDALGRPDGAWRDPRRLEQLVRAVAYCQQPRHLERFRAGTADLLAGLDEADLALWFDRKRLTALGLPGGSRLSPWRSVRLLAVADALDRRTGGALRRLARERYTRAGDDVRAGMGAVEARRG